MSKLAQLAINQEGFVFDPTTGESFTVNHVGLMVLNLLREGKTEAEVAEALGAAYEDVPLEVQADVADFMNRLRDYKID